MEDTSEVTSWQTMSLTQLTKAIQTQKGVVEDLAGVDEKQAAAENKILKQMEARKKLLEGRYGLGNGGSEKKDSKKGVLEGIDKEALQEVDDYIKRVDKEIEAYFHHIDEESERTMRDLLKPSQAEQYGVKNLLGIGEGLELELTMRVEGAELAKQNIDTLRRLLSVAKDEEKEKINEAIAYWSKYNVNLDSAKSRGETIEETLGGLGSIMGSLSGIVGEGAAGWLQWASNVFSAISSALPEIAKLVGGNIAQAYAGAIAQSQSVPPPMNYILLGTNLAAVAEAVAKIPKFANGNVAYGATLGIFGEYANAATNPEVTMPADKLRSIIFGSGGAPKEIRLRARGRDLVGSIKVEQLIRSRG